MPPRPPPESDPVPGPPPSPAPSARRAEAALRELLRVLLRARTGPDVRAPGRAAVLRRLGRRLQAHGLAPLPAYRALLQAQPPQATALLQGLLAGVTGCFRELAASNAELQAANAELATVNRALRTKVAQSEAPAIGATDEFLAVMSHELKNPLNFIQLNAELLARLPEARDLPAVQRAAGIIRRTVVSQAQVIDDLLDLSRIDNGTLVLDPEPVDWPAVVAAIADALRQDARARDVTLHVEPPAEALVVHADPVRVEQIVWNLVANAVKVTPARGRVTLSLARDEACARLDVVDTGRGIAPEVLPHVFDPFRPVEPGAARVQGGGLGIGLAVVRQLATLLGGRAEAASEGSGRGARFSVWLPLARPG